MEIWAVFLKEFNKTFLVENRWKIFLKGFQNTLLITGMAVLMGIAIGAMIAILKYLGEDDGRGRKTAGSVLLSIVNHFCSAYVAVLRGTPLAIQLMITAFIIMAGFPNKILVAGVAFGLNSGAYVSEVIRAGIASVDKGQMEAGWALGLGRITTMRLIVLPQALKNILPALCNEVIAVLKETSLVGLVAIVDLTRASDLVRSRTYSPYFPLLFVALVYFVLVFILSLGVGRLERRLAQGN